MRSPQEVVDWFFAEFDYEWRFSKSWQAPQEMISSRKGSCIDFAILASSLLSEAGIPNEVLLIYFEDLRVGHAICMWREGNGRYSFISSAELFRTETGSLEEAVEFYYPGWERIIFAELRGAKKFYKKIIRRQDDKTHQNPLLFSRNNI